jgi:hypothetical protein
MTGSHRTMLGHKLKDLSHHSQILSALGIEGPTTNPIHGCISSLRAAVEMAKSDAGSQSWLRTLEQVDGDTCSSVSGSTTKAYADIVASVTPAKDRSLLRTEAVSAQQVRDRCTQYHRHQYAFEKCLLEFRDQLSSNDRPHFESLFDLRFADMPKPHRLIKDKKHLEVFEMISKFRGKIVFSAAVTLLRKTIVNRERVMRHFQNLEGHCPDRERKNKSHQKFLDVLKAGEVTITQKRTAEDDLIEVEGWELAQNGSRKKQKRG